MFARSFEEKLSNLQPLPSKRFYSRMARAAWNPAVMARRRFFAAAGSAIALSAALLVFTPQGRALAQEILHFFTRAESDAVVVALPSESTTFDFNQAVAEAEQKAGFDILQPGWLPKDAASGKELLSLQGAMVETDHNIARLFYRYALGGDDITDGLVIREERFQTDDDCELCGKVGASAAFETVSIGSISGEYVEGVWSADDQGVWNWVADPYVKTLRWQSNGMAFEMQYFGLEISRSDLIAIAESMR